MFGCDRRHDDVPWFDYSDDNTISMIIILMLIHDLNILKDCYLVT